MRNKFALMIMTLLLSVAALGQPAPELLFYKTQPNPAFISVSNLTMDFVDEQDYLFAYTSEMRCAGTYSVVSDPNFLPAFGKDAWNPGFDYNEAIGVGIYDSQTGIFYKLQGNTKGWNGKSTQLKWMPLNLLRFEITGIDGEVDLIVDEQLAEVKLTITGPETWNTITQNENYYFNVNAKNISNYVVTASQAGELKEIRRWFNDTFWNHLYTPDADDNSVTLTAVGTNKWTGEVLQFQKLVQFTSIDEPKPTGDALYENQYFKIVLIDDVLYLEAVSTVPVYVNFQVNNRSTTKYLVSSKGTKAGDRKKVASTKNLTDFKINWAMYKGVDGLPKYVWTAKQMINESVNL